MKELKEDLIDIYYNDRSILILAFFNFFIALGLFIFSIVHLNPNDPVVKIGYGDIGGYRDGAWSDLIAFPLLAVTFGILHSLLSVRIFHKRGGSMAKFFLIATIFLSLGALLVLIRLLGEG